jgi:predicted phage tail protein
LFGTLAAGTPGPWAAGVVGGAFATAAGTAFSAVGASLILSGTASLLTPSASLTNPAAGIRASRNAAALQSYNFTGIQNTSIQGTPIPLVYGKIYTGSITISAGIATTEI